MNEPGDGSLSPNLRVGKELSAFEESRALIRRVFKIEGHGRRELFATFKRYELPAAQFFEVPVFFQCQVASGLSVENQLCRLPGTK